MADDNFKLYSGQSVSVPSVSPGEDFKQGQMDLLKIGSLEQAYKIQKEKHEQEVQDHTDKMVDRGLSKLSQAAKMKGPAQKLLFDQGAQLLGPAGYPVSQNILAYLKSNYEPFLQALEKANTGGKSVSTVEFAKDFLQAFADGGEIPEASFKFIEKLVENESSQAKLATAMEMNKQNNATKKDVAGMSTEEAKIQARKEAVQAVKSLGLSQADEDKLVAQILNQGQGFGSPAALEERRKSRLMRMVKEVTANGYIQKARPLVASANGMLANLDDKIKAGKPILIRDLKEANTEVSRLISGSSVVPVGREKSYNFTTYGQALQDVWDRTVTGHEATPVAPDQVQIVRTRLVTLRDKIKEAMMEGVHTQLGALAGVGAVTQEEAQSVLDSVISPGKGMNSMRSGTSAGPKKPTPAFTEQLKGVFKGDSARMLEWMKSKGYDTSGVK